MDHRRLFVPLCFVKSSNICSGSIHHEENLSDWFKHRGSRLADCLPETTPYSSVLAKLLQFFNVVTLFKFSRQDTFDKSVFVSLHVHCVNFFVLFDQTCFKRSFSNFEV